MSFLIGAIGIVIVFGLVIFIHEFGHFIVAKKSGVKVERFSFGLGPEAVGFQWGETRYCLAWIPLGGEVRMAGDAEYGELPPESPAAPPPSDEPGRPLAAAAHDPRDFYAQPWHRRVLIVLAGPGMNYVLAFVLFAAVAFLWGEPRPSGEPVIGDLIPGYPAQEAGLVPGDRIVSVAGEGVDTWKALADAIHRHPDQTVALEVRRGEEAKSLQIRPRKDPVNGVGLIGIAPATVHEKVGFLPAVSRGAEQTIGWSLFTLEYLGQKIVRREKPDLAGPIGIASVVAKATKSGAKDFLYLIALISVGIGLFNLFPIPLLDGGHLMFYVWEGITRKPVTRKVMQAANVAGLTLLLGILLFATYSDIQRMRPAQAPVTDATVETGKP
jgi:regulator of sigma E protease